MKNFNRCLIVLAMIAIACPARGHGFNFMLSFANGGYAINSSSGEDQLDSFGTPGTTGSEASNLFYYTFSTASTTTLGKTFYTVPDGFATTDGAWPPPTFASNSTVGWTATFNIISPLYFSDGNEGSGASGAVVASSGTSMEMYDRDYPGGTTSPGTSPGYVTIGGATPFNSGFQVSLDDPHEIEKELILAPGSTQTFGEYGFAYDVTVSFNSGQTITTGPLVDVFAISDPNLGDFSDNAYYLQQDAATTAIYNAALGAGATVLGLTSSWSGTTNNAWNNSANWEATGIPGATTGATSNDTVAFYSGTTTPVIDAGRNVQTILFESANVGALALGTTGGNSLLLTNGGSIQVTSWVVNPQVVNAPLVLEGANALYTFNSDSTTASATLSFGGSITGGAAGNTVLTLGGDNTGANTISGVISNGAATSLALLESGPCNWILTGQNTYTGGTTVNQGTLTVTAAGTFGSSTSPLTISTAANGVAATVNINGNQSVGTLSGTILGGATTGTLNIAAGSTLTVNQAASTDFGATLNVAAGTAMSFGTFALQGPNTLEIDAAPTLGANSAIRVNGGTLRFNLSSGAATVGSGVTVTVASAATLQLAGSVSALSGGGTANILNNGSTASGGGLSVTGANQTVGTITGAGSTTGGVTTYSGDTVVGNGTSPASLTATQILQNTLTINAGSTVTIQPSGSGISDAVSSDGAASSSALTATDDGSVADSATGSEADPFIAVQAAIASGAISSQTGQRLENRIAAILRLQTSDPGSNVALLEDSVLTAIPSSDSTAAPLLGDVNSSLLGADLAAGNASNSIASSFGEISDGFASAGNGPAAVPEPSAFLLAALGGIAVALAARTQATGRETSPGLRT